MPLESSITSSIIAYIKRIGGQAEKVQGTSASSGRPDINACYKGRCIRIEVKTPDHKNKTSKKQDLNLARWRKSGAITIVAYSKSAVMYFLTCFNIGETGAFLYSEDNGCASTAYIPSLGFEVKHD